MLWSLKAHVYICVCLYQVIQVERLLIKRDVFLCSLLDQALLTKWSGVKLSSNIKYLEAFAFQLQLHTSFIRGIFVKYAVIPHPRFIEQESLESEDQNLCQPPWHWAVMARKRSP